MNRADRVLRHIDPLGVGLEIGPSHNPIAPKSMGYQVHILDHLSADGLRAKYKDHAVALGNIEEVDFVWQGGSWVELTGQRKYYDWIIASHVIEHTPDLVGFLLDCDAVLKDSGVLSLVVPDKRYCFDRYRPTTGIAQIIDSHLSGNTVHSPGAVADYFLNVVRRSGELAWKPGLRGSDAFAHTSVEAEAGMRAVQRDRSYFDVHAWCFVPHSFRLLIHDLYDLGLIQFKEVTFFSDQNESEFFVTLGRSGSGPALSRMELIQAMENELFILHNNEKQKSAPWWKLGHLVGTHRDGHRG